MYKQFNQEIHDSKIMLITYFLKKYSDKYGSLQEFIDNYNKLNYYYKLEIDELYIYLIVDTYIKFNREERYNTLIVLFLTNLFKIDEYEIIFARSRKTIYKDIQKIKSSFYEQLKNVDIEMKMQDILNKFSKKHIEYIMEFKGVTFKTIISNAIATLENFANIKSSVKFKNYNVNILEKQNEYEENISYAKIIANEIINQLQYYTKTVLNNDHIRKLLEIHIAKTYYNYRYNIFTNYSNIDHIKSNYQHYYNKVKIIVLLVFSTNNLYINEEHIIYIFLYFINKNDFINKKVKIYTAKTSEYILLVNQLEKYFENFEIVEDNCYDLLITTLNVKDGLIVNKEFTTIDLINISKYLKYIENQNITMFEEFRRIKHLLKHNVSFNQYQDAINLKEEDIIKTKIGSLLTETRILKTNKSMTWKEAINEGTLLLEKDNIVSEKYKDIIIQLIEEFGSYIVLSNDFALPHVQNVSNVNETAVSLIISTKPIIFPNDRHVHIIMTLASINNFDYLLPLKHLNDLLQDNYFSEKIMSYTNVEILKYLNT